MKPTIATTYLLIIPLISSLYFGIYLHVILIFFSMIFSVAYHQNSERTLVKGDSIFATAVFVYNLYLLFLIRNFAVFVIPIVLVTILSFVFKYAEKENYELYHSLWHVLVITGTFLCSLGYGLHF